MERRSPELRRPEAEYRVSRSAWNYRIVHKRCGDEDSFQIHEAYYDDDKLVAVTENAVAAFGETHEELKADLEYMMKALGEPVLEEGDLPTSQSE